MPGDVLNLNTLGWYKSTTQIVDTGLEDTAEEIEAISISGQAVH
jgi:hypothetical protein